MRPPARRFCSVYKSVSRQAEQVVQCVFGLATLQTIITQVREADASCRSWVQSSGSSKPLPFGQMAWRDHLKVPAVKGGDLMQVEPLGERYHTCIHGLKPQRRVGGEQFSHPSVVMRRDLDDAELVVGDGGAEFSGQADAAAPLRIGQQMTDLGDSKRRDHQTRPVPGRISTHRA